MGFSYGFSRRSMQASVGPATLMYELDAFETRLLEHPLFRVSLAAPCRTISSVYQPVVAMRGLGRSMTCSAPGCEHAHTNISE